MGEEKLTRLNKYLSEIGYCSRRAADKLLDDQRIKINGKIAVMGLKIGPMDRIEIDGKNVQIPAKSDRVYLMVNKPTGIVCTTDTRVEKDNIVDFINYPSRIFPIGRLDKASEGLLLMTDDGDIVNKILRSRNHHEKEYIVKVDQVITESFLSKMRSGIPMLETMTKPCYVSAINKHEFKIILTQGLNRQIRRMCAFLDYQVVSLQRIRIMNIKLDIPYGKWRNLREEELIKLHGLLEHSAKTFDE